MLINGFLGPSDVQMALALDPSQSINLFAIVKQAGTPKKVIGMPPRPVLRPRYKAPSGPVRGSFTINGRAWAVCGGDLVELRANGDLIVRGNVAVDSFPATFASNGLGGEQLMITSGGLGYIFSTETNLLTQIVDASFPTYVRRCEFLASKFIVQNPSRNEFFYSQEYDGLDWNALDFIEPSLTADIKVSMFADHGNLWLHGQQRTEIWQPQDNLNTPFAPIPSAIIEQGTTAGFSVTRLDNTIFWCQGDERGNRMIVRADAYSPKRVSTNALEFYLNQQSQHAIENSIGYAFQKEGHAFYALYIPGAPFTPVYDASTDMWFDWAHWDSVNLVWRQFRARNHIFFSGRNLLGSPTDGVIYELTFDYEADARVVS